MPDAGLVFQRDSSILITPGNGFNQVVHAVRRCAHFHSIVADSHRYVVSPTAVWGSAAAGLNASDVVGGLARYSTMPVPLDVAARIADLMRRYGAIELVDTHNGPTLKANDSSIFDAIGVERPIDGSTSLRVAPGMIAALKVQASRSGWPIVDRLLRKTTGRAIALSNVSLRPYQRESLAAFNRGRDGVVLLPCGAGKTLVGVAAAASTGGPILVLTPSRTVGEQWVEAFRKFTDVEDAGWLDRARDQIQVTVATYHAVTVGRASNTLLGHPWRLVVYDEVQSLPADVFRSAANIEAERRLGLSATLVREDGREVEVFALVGPVLYEASWLELERDGWIAPARCIEVRIPVADSLHEAWRYKMAVTERLVQQHGKDSIIIVGTDVANLRATGRRLNFPVLTGESSSTRREEVYAAFRSGELRRVGLSRIGSVGVDLPDASVMIQISGTYGSRQEEAQRLGRILRPSEGKTAHFYTLVTAGTREQHFAARRQRYLANQGYLYEIIDASSIPRVPTADR